MSQYPSMGIVIVLVSLVCFIYILRIIQVKTGLRPEFVRKTLHVVMGFETLAFPWFFHEFWPVLLLAVISMILFSILRFYPPLRRSFGSVIYSIKRDSFGEFFFPLGVASLFYLADGGALLYSISILALVIGDSTAALVGIRIGRIYYHSINDKKTLEGTFSFFFITSLITLIMLKSFMETNLLDAFLISLNAGIILALVEAIGTKGSDNYFIPVVSIIALEKIMAYSTSINLLIFGNMLFFCFVLYSIRGIHTNIMFTND